MKLKLFFFFLFLPLLALAADSVLILNAPDERLNGSYLKDKELTAPSGDYDFQMVRSQSQTVFRVKKKSTINFGADWQPFRLSKGLVLFNIVENNRTPFTIITPHLFIRSEKAGFELEAEREPDFFSSSMVAIHRGEVNVRIRIPQIEDLPASVIKKSIVLSYITDSLQKTSSTLKKGDFVTVDDYDTQAFLVHTGLLSILQNTPVSQLAQVIDPKFNNPAFKKKIDEYIQEPLSFLIDRYDAASYQKKITELSALQPVEQVLLADTTRLREVLQKRSRQHQVLRIMQIIEQIEKYQKNTNEKLLELRKQVQLLKQFAKPARHQKTTIDREKPSEEVKENQTGENKPNIEPIEIPTKDQQGNNQSLLKQLEENINLLEKKIDKLEQMKK